MNNIVNNEIKIKKPKKLKVKKLKVKKINKKHTVSIYTAQDKEKHNQNIINGLYLLKF
jgi:hypothetical protein